MIRRANDGDIDAINNSYIELLTYEKENGSSSNWKLNVYPTKKTAEDALKEGSLFVLEENGEVCASAIFDKKQAAEYDKISWKYKADKDEVMVVHTLCIPPSKSHRGFGKQMVEYAFDYAKRLNCRVIRLDTAYNNEPAQRLYTNMGFVISGEDMVLHHGVLWVKLVYLERSLNGL